MKKIIKMGKEEILSLKAEEISWPLMAEEIVHIATALGAFWMYDYEATKHGKVGMHALLKSGRHSDGFFVSRILLEPENIRRIIANQIVMKLRAAKVPRPDYVVGVPDGATILGEEVARIIGARNGIMKKINGRISLVSRIKAGESVLLVEDFCTRGTGFAEAVTAIVKNQPKAKILPYDPVIINRGWLKDFLVAGVGKFAVLPVAEQRIQDWEPAECPLCVIGSKPIKPKETDKNWYALTISQK